MCILCYGLTGEEHWTDARVGAEPDRERPGQAPALLTQIVGAHGLAYKDDPSGFTAMVSDRKGGVQVARNLGEVWAAASTWPSDRWTRSTPSCSRACRPRRRRSDGLGARPCPDRGRLPRLGQDVAAARDARRRAGRRRDRQRVRRGRTRSRAVRACEERVELVGGGCACCTRREDLVRVLRELLDARDRGAGRSAPRGDRDQRPRRSGADRVHDHSRPDAAPPLRRRAAGGHGRRG